MRRVFQNMGISLAALGTYSMHVDVRNVCVHRNGAAALFLASRPPQFHSTAEP